MGGFHSVPKKAAPYSGNPWQMNFEDFVLAVGKIIMPASETHTVFRDLKALNVSRTYYQVAKRNKSSGPGNPKSPGTHPGNTLSKLSERYFYIAPTPLKLPKS